MMKKWKILAISDTHLGEEASLLSHKAGRRRLYEALQAQLGGGPDEKFEVEDLVLIGDIPDRTLSSTSEIMTHTYALMKTVLSAAQINRIIYIPGNHDHTIWTNYRNQNQIDRYVPEAPEGDLILKTGDYSNADKAPEILSMFFGYSRNRPESLWQKIAAEEKLEFAVANPVFAKKYNNHTYAFAHGTHFRKDVTASDTLKAIADYAQLDKLFGGIEIESDVDVEDAVDLADLERRVTPFVDSLWPSSGDETTGRSDKLWYLLTMISGKFKRNKRTPPDTDILLNVNELRDEDKNQGRIRRIDDHDSLKRCTQYFFPHLLTYLQQNQLDKDQFTFIYGDTHDGGWNELVLPGNEKVRVFNCGAWVAHNAKDHPDCNAFALDDAGMEHMLDITFKDVTVMERPILDVASSESEHRRDKISRLMQFFLERILGMD